VLPAEDPVRGGCSVAIPAENEVADGILYYDHHEMRPPPIPPSELDGSGGHRVEAAATH